ncbi:glrx-3 [Pristionchus pacificus]|uniref:Glrx-3 n=1 Tax=Pristionchus pacificus TaxID=54126 RepID=A0A2A6CT12_PRIPA|nr:glrx-3 [Pristionchus pacificus]|eukprot:PDM81335.1 glrx-3 [Pristionchus pacificus]
MDYLLQWPIFLLLLTGLVFNCSNRNSTRKIVRSKSRKSGKNVKTEATDSKTTETSVACNTEAKAIHQKESTGVANLFAQETTIAASFGRKSEKDQRSRKSGRGAKQKSASERATRDKAPTSTKSKRFSQRSERTRSKEKLRSVSDPPSLKTKKSEELVENRTNTKSVSERNSQRNSERNSQSPHLFKSGARMADALKQLESQGELASFTAGPELSLVHFFAEWAPQCKQLNTVIEDLASELGSSFTASYIDAEKVAEASLKAKIKAAPTVVFYRNGSEVGRLDGFKPAELRTLIVKYSSGVTGAAVETAPSGQSLTDRLKALINKESLMLFMKGDPSAPKCGFSRTIVGMLNEHSIAFGSFDILSDEDVRQGLKEYSNWPTYPQLYLNGELLGGLDVVREEFKDADFIASLPKRS